MTLILLIVIGTFALALLLALVLSCKYLFARVIASLLALGFAAFCAFGFLASYELSEPDRRPWQIGYGVLGLTALGGAVALLRSCRRTGT